MSNFLFWLQKAIKKLSISRRKALAVPLLFFFLPTAGAKAQLSLDSSLLSRAGVSLNYCFANSFQSFNAISGKGGIDSPTSAVFPEAYTTLAFLVSFYLLSTCLLPLSSSLSGMHVTFLAGVL